MKKYIKSLLALATAALLGSSAGAAANTENIPLCFGDKCERTMSVSSSGAWAQATQGDSTIVSASGFSTTSAKTKTVTFTAQQKAGSTTWKFTRGSSNSWEYKFTVVKPTEVSLCVGDTAQLYFYNSTKKSWTTSLNDTAFTATTAQSGNGVTVTRSADTGKTKPFNILVTASTAGKSDTIIVSDGSNTYAYKVTTSAARTVQIGSDVTQTCVSGLSRAWTPTGDTYASVKVNPTTAATSVTATITGKAIGSSSVTVNNANTSSTTTGSLGANYTLKTTVTKKEVQGEAKTVAVGKTVTIDDESSASAWTGKSTATVTAKVTASGNAGEKPVISGEAVGNTTVTIENTTTIYTYAVMVTEAPLEFEYESVNFVVSGAEKSFVNDELLLKFTKSGTMTIDGELKNAKILVVGGGGGGGPGGSSEAGTGGKGADVTYKDDETLIANTYDVSVGDGGAAGSGQGTGGAGDPSSFGTFSANGGTGGARKGNKAGDNGANSGKYNISGEEISYGQGGAKASTSTAGSPGASYTGAGGQAGGSGSKNGGTGGSGVVILRVPAQKPVKTLDPVALYTGNKTTVSTACDDDPSEIKVTSDKENVATATAAISDGQLTITVQAGTTTGTANIKVETASSFYTVAVTVNPKPQVIRASTADSVKAGRPAKSHQLQEAFPQAATWTGDVTSGHANIATATMVNGGEATTQPTMLITPVGEGTTTLTVTSSTDDYDYVWTVTITVLPSGGYVPVPQPEETADSKMHLAYVAGHADQAVIRNYYFGTGGSDGYQFDFKSEVTGSGVSATTTTTGSIADGSTGLTTVTATSATGSGKVAIGRVKYKTGNPPTTGHKNDCNYNTASRVQRVVYVGKTATAYGVFSISINDTAETGTTGSWKTPTVANGLVTAENVAGVSFEHNFVSVTGVSVGWEQVTSEFMTDSPHNPPQPEGVTYTFNFQVRDTPAAEGLIPDQQINFNTKLSTIDLNTQGIVMKDSNGNVVPGEFEWDNPDKTWNARETTVETAVFTATGANAEFYDPVAVDVTIIAGKPKEPSTGIFGDPILVTMGTRELTDVPFAWTSWKVVGDDIGVTVEAAPSGNPLVKAGAQAGKTVIWIENDDYYRVYEVKVYETKAIDVEGYKNSTKRVKLTSAAEAVWTAHSDDESVATVSMASSEPSANAEATIVCKGEENDTVSLTVQNDYVVYTVNVTVKGEKQPETGKFNLAAGETAVMSLYYGGDSPAERCFRVNKEEDGISVNRDYAENKNQKTLNLTFTGLQDDGSATVGIQQKQSYDSGNFAAYTGNYITTAVAQPKRIMYLGDTKQLYCLSSEAAAWTVVPADDGVVDVTAPSGAVAEGYAQVSGGKVGTTSFVIGNTAEVADGFFKGVTYTINYEVRGMPMADGDLTGDANLTVGDQLSTIDVAGSMKDAKNHEVFGTFAWVDGTQTFDVPGTETVEAIFTPENTSYDSVKVDVVVTVKIPVDVPTAVTGLTYDGTVQTGVEDGTGYTLAGNTATAAGNHTATATLADGYCWKDDGSTEPKTIGWSIAKVALTATADDQNTTYGAEAPEFTVSYTGWVKGEEDPTTEPVLESKYVVGADVGTYDITFATDPVFANYAVTTEKGALAVVAAELTSATATPASAIYTGGKQEPVVTAKAGELDATFGNIVWDGNLTDVGTHTATVTGSGNFKGAATATFTITKASIDMSGVTFEPMTVTYDGTPYDVEIEGDLPDGVSVSYDGNGQTDARDTPYTVTAIFSLTEEKAKNYNIPEAMTTTLKIDPAALTSASAAPQAYTGSQLTPVVTAKAKELDATFDVGAWDGDLVNVGTYTATVTGKDNFTGEVPVTFEITAKEVGLDWTDTTFMYDGQPHKPTATATGICEGDDVSVTVVGEQIAVGTYTATATALMGAKAGNYKLPAEVTTQFTILKSSKKPWADGSDPEGAGYAIPGDANDWTSLTNETPYSAFDYRGAYDGKAHTIDTSALVAAYETACVAAPTITYSCDTNANDWAAAPIELTDVGATSVWYRISVPNYENVIRVAKIVIDPAQVTVTADNAEKTEGEDDPAEFTAKVAGTVAGDEDTIAYTVTREEGETVGEYAIIPSGDETQGNYKVTYVNGTFTIKAKPTITITIAKDDESIVDVQTNGVTVVGELELPADATTVELKLVKDDWLTIPVYKVITNDVTNVTQRVASYPVVPGLTYTFIAEEAEEDDPTVTPTDTKKAIIDAIDDENKEAVAPKIEAVVDTSDEPAADKVSAKDMATWITDNGIKSADMAQSDYLVASVKLDTSAPITTENTEIEFKAIEEVSSETFTFDLSMIVDSESVDFEEGMEEVVASCIQTTGDLGTGFDGATVSASRVTINSDGTVTIEPDSTKSAEFFKIVIPRDLGTK